MSSDAALALNKVDWKLIIFTIFLPDEKFGNSRCNKDGLSAIQVWGRDEEGGARAVGDGGRGGPPGAGEDDKEALAAHIEAMFSGDLK